jgi:hypothetical protein
MARSIRYRGRVKVVEQTGPWGMYQGERIVCGDGRAVDDDLGVKIRKVVRAAEAESIDLADVEIRIKVHRRRWSLRR